MQRAEIPDGEKERKINREKGRETNEWKRMEMKREKRDKRTYLAYQERNRPNLEIRY